MTTATHEFSVGDKVIVHLRNRYGCSPDSDPIVTDVIRVSPKTGRPTVELEGRDGKMEKVQFNPDNRFYRMYEAVPDSYGYGVVGKKHTRYEDAKLFHYHPALIEAINEVIAERKKQLEKRKADEQKKQAEREAREDQKMNELHAACRGDDGISRLNVVLEEQVDKIRMYVVKLPVHPDYAERKGGAEMMIVKCWDADSNRFINPVGKKIGYAMTYSNSLDERSFSSCSTQYADNDASALWEAAKDCYHNWY